MDKTIVHDSSLDDGCMIVHSLLLFVRGSSLDDGCVNVCGSSLWFIVVHGSFIRSRVSADLVCGSSLFVINHCEI